MKPSRLQFGLFGLLFIPSIVVATNWLALTWTRTDDWTYFIQKSPGVLVEETSTVRLLGWPIPYNVAFPSESFGARNFHWIPFVVDCVVATLVAFAVYWLYRCVMKQRRSNHFPQSLSASLADRP